MSYFCFIKDKFYVPEEILDMDAVRENYSHQVYDEQMCRGCPYRRDRHSFMCDPCAGYQGIIKTYRPIRYHGEHYIGLPIGDKRRFRQYIIPDISELEIEDRRIRVRFKYKVKFTGKLRDYQEPLVEDFMKRRYGLLEAPPRTGKTPTTIYLIVQLGRRALILANQIEFLQNFETHIREFTNLPDIERRTGKKLFGIAKKEQDFFDYEIALSTYQRFLSPGGQELLKRIEPLYGSLAVDEVHKVAASCFLRVVSRIPALYKFGCSATPDRKDKKEVLVYQILGPVVARTRIESMTPVVHVTATGFAPKMGRAPTQWTRAMKWLAEHEPRNDLIIEQVMKDLEAGHSIVLPSVFKDHIFYLTKRINAEWGGKVAESFVGGGSKQNKYARECALERAQSGKTRVVVGTRSLLQLGLNVPRWSCLYSIFPISNKPNLKQETSRIRTPMPGKREPVIRFFVDNLDQSLYCFRSSYNHLRDFQYKFSPDSVNTIKGILSKLGGKQGFKGEVFELYDGMDDYGQGGSYTPKRIITKGRL